MPRDVLIVALVLASGREQEAIRATLGAARDAGARVLDPGGAQFAEVVSIAAVEALEMAETRNAASRSARDN